MVGNSFKDIYLGFTLIPLLPAIILFLLGYLRYLKRRDWEKEEAVTIADHKFGLGYPKPTVRYEVNGIVYEEQSKIGQKPPLPSGKRVEVFYNPDKPKEMIIDTFIQRGSFLFLVGGVFFFFAMIFLIFGVIMRSMLNVIT